MTQNQRLNLVQLPLSAVLTVLLLAGCQTPSHKEHKIQAEQNWNHVRSQIKYKLAIQQFEAGQAEAAATTAEEAIGLDPTAAENYVLLIKSLLEQGNLGAADRVLEAAQNKQLDSADLSYAAGMLAERAGDAESAVEWYRRACHADPAQLDYMVAYAETLVMVSQPDEARQLVLENMDRFDRDGTLDILLAEISMLLGDDHIALVSYRQALPLLENDPQVVEEFGQLLFQKGRYAEAVSVLDPLVAGQGSKASAAAVRALTASLVEVERFDAALIACGDWLANHPEDSEVWLIKSRALLAMDITAAAIHSAKTVVRIDPNRAEAHLIQAYCHWKQNDPESARSSLDRLINIAPQDALAHRLLAQVLSGAGETVLAQQHRSLADSIDQNLATPSTPMYDQDEQAELTSELTPQ